MTDPDRRRRAVSRLVVLLFVLTIAASAALLVPTTRGDTSHAVASPATTVTSTSTAWNWDPLDPNKPGELFDNPRSVTIDQTDDLVSQVIQVSWQNFSPSGNTNSAGPGNYPVHVYECDRAEPVDPGNCFGDLDFVTEHPGYGLVGDQTNEVQTYTNRNGTGSVDFDVLTAADNPALGCDPTHQCSLVVVPWPGGRPATGKKPADCSDHSLDLRYYHNEGDWALPGASPLNRGCDWDERIVVPLSFSPTPLNCPDRNADLSTEGSPMMRRAIDQWRTGICNGGDGQNPLQVQYTGLSEYQARSDFDRDAIDVGLTSQPATDTTRTFSYTPIGVTSIDVAYYIDDPLTGKQITDLRLDPRLIAKLLTQSYTDNLSTDCKQESSYACAPEVAGNPSSIFDDKEFLALNPEYTRADFPFTTQGNSSPDVVYGLSDNTHQLTSWLGADPDAAAFLAGEKDPSGMHVNAAYLPSVSPKYPVDAFNANDTGHTLTVPSCGYLDPYGEYSCAVGGLQNNWFPINGLDNVASTLVQGKNTAKLYRPSCDGNNPPIRNVCTHYVSAPAEPLGTRGLFAIVDGGDAAAYQFPVAQLETNTGSNKFVAPSTSTLTTALGDMTPNADGTTAALHYSGENPSDAYPLTTVSYAMTPTCGLDSDGAASVAAFLDYVASDKANTPGVQPGQLAPGFLPLTSDMRTETHDLAGKVATESACSSGSTSPSSPGSGGTSQSSGPEGGNNPGSGDTGNTGDGGNAGDGSDQGVGGPVGPDGGNDNPNGNGSGSGGPGGTGSPGASGSGTAAPSASSTPAAFPVPSSSTGAPALFLPVILCIGAALALAGPSVLYFSKRGQRTRP